jgi:spore germination protein KA
MTGRWGRNSFEKDSKSNKETKESLPFGDRPFVSSDINKNLQRLKKDIGNSPDVTIREYHIEKLTAKVTAIFSDSLVDMNAVNNFIKQALTIEKGQSSDENNAFEIIKTNALKVQEIKVIRDWDEILLSILTGDTVIMIDGFAHVITGSTKGGEERSIAEPTTQTVVRGPKDCFTESIATNISLVRRRISSPNLWLETMRIGEETQTTIGIMYMKGIVSDNLIQEVKERLI